MAVINKNPGNSHIPCPSLDTKQIDLLQKKKHPAVVHAQSAFAIREGGATLTVINIITSLWPVYAAGRRNTLPVGSWTSFIRNTYMCYEVIIDAGLHQMA